MEDLFPRKEGLDFTRLKTTEEGAYSITRRRDAERILNIIRIVVKDLSTKTITDATACIGGDTINFALHFKEVHSIELKKENYDILQNNVNVYELTNVNLYHGDCTNLYTWYSDVLYIDPPWGGRDYKEQKCLELFLTNKRLDVWLEEILLQKSRPSHIILKLPSNYNFKQLDVLPNAELIKAYQIRSYVLIIISVHKAEKRIAQSPTLVR
jgi:predicted RNA methylase